MKKTAKKPTLTSRTQEEIVKRINAIKEDDFFGFETGDLIEYLDFDHAKEFLKPEVTKKEWNKNCKTLKTAEAQIFEYIPFAWDKANNCRGLSAGRSMNHMRAWLWLAGETDLSRACEHYNYYGKPNLVDICEKYEIDWKMLDDGEWRNNESETPITASEALCR